MIVSLGSERVPSVRVVLSGAELTAGQPWSLLASYTDGLGEAVTYRPRAGSGTGAGSQVVLVDAAAPIRTPVTYRLTVGTAVVSTSTITRTSPASDVMVSLSGGVAVGFRRAAQGGDRRGSDRRYHASEVPGSRYAPLRLGPVAGAGGGSFVASTEGVDTALMRSLMDANTPCYVLHSCSLDGCDVPLVDLVYVTGDANDRGAGVAPRMWSLTYLAQADPEPDTLLGISTWDAFDAAWSGKTFDDFDAFFAGKTFDLFDLTDWATLG